MEVSKILLGDLRLQGITKGLDSQRLLGILYEFPRDKALRIACRCWRIRSKVGYCSRRGLGLLLRKEIFGDKYPARARTDVRTY